MKFKLVEDLDREFETQSSVDTLNESVVSTINRTAKAIMKREVTRNTEHGIDPAIFDSCLRHHIGGKSDYESSAQLKRGILNPSIIIPNFEETDYNQAVIHSIIEHYSGTNVLDLIRYIYKMCNEDVIYHCSNNGTHQFKKSKLYKLISELNR